METVSVLFYRVVPSSDGWSNVQGHCVRGRSRILPPSVDAWPSPKQTVHVAFLFVTYFPVQRLVFVLIWFPQKTTVGRWAGDQIDGVFCLDPVFKTPSHLQPGLVSNFSRASPGSALHKFSAASNGVIAEDSWPCGRKSLEPLIPLPSILYLTRKRFCFAISTPTPIPGT